MPIRTVILDLGNVLIRFDPMIALRKLTEYTHLDARTLWQTVRDTELEHQYERGEISTEHFIQRALAAGQLSCSLAEFKQIFQRIFEPNTDVVAAIPALASQYRIVLASNTNDAHFEYLQSTFPVLEHFHALGVSHLAKARKPETRFYEYVHGLTGCLPEECLFVDDLPMNVEAAKQFGWHAEVYSAESRFRDLLSKHQIVLPSDDEKRSS